MPAVAMIISDRHRASQAREGTGGAEVPEGVCCAGRTCTAATKEWLLWTRLRPRLLDPCGDPGPAGLRSAHSAQAPHYIALVLM